MSVSISPPVDENALFVPFRGFDREAGAVGTLYFDAQAAGDGSGGTVTINVQMKKLEFGFHPLWIPTRVSTQDDLATAEVVAFAFRSSGMERLSGDLREASLALAVANSLNVAAFRELGVAVETQSLTNITVMQAIWLTNTDGKVYHVHIYGILYDGEALARGKRAGKAPDQLLGGVR